MQEEYKDGEQAAPHERLAYEPGKALSERSDTVLSPHLLEPAETRETEENELNLLDLWRVLVKRKWTIITFFLIVVISVVTATFLMTPLYRAGLTLQIDREAAKILETGSVIPNESTNDLNFYQTQYELLRSRSLAERVIEQLNLAENPVFMGATKPPFWQPLLDWMKELLGRSQPKEVEPTSSQDLVPRFLYALAVEPVRNSRLVKVYFESPDPQLAASVINTFAEVYINLNLERRFEATAYAKSFLQERLKQIKAKLEDSERKLVEYARQEQIVNIDDRQTITNQELQQTATALGGAEEQRMRAEAIYTQMRNQGGQGLTQILENPVIQEFKAMKAKMEAEYQENLKLYKPAYPKMRQLAGQIQELESKIGTEVGYIRSSIKANYEAAKANEGLLRNKLEEIKDEVMGLQNRSIEYNIFKREVDTNRQLYDGLLQRYKEVGVAGGVGTNNITIVDRAEPPAFPYKPNFKINALLAMIVGLIGGVGLAFLFEHLDDTIKLPEDMERLAGIPVLGIIPAVKERHGRDRDHSDDSLALSAHKDPRSAFAEAYRSVRTALQFSTPDGPPRVLSVTSSVAGEGKSTTSLSLAIHFAQAGKQVLLIDADLRNPSLYRTLKIDNSFGLTNYLAGGAKPAEIAKPCPQVPHLSVVTSGPLPPNPAELLSTPKMLSLLSSAAEKYEQVILDCPPVLGLADALVLGNMSEGTLLVVEAGHTRRGYVQGSLKRLRSARTRILGGILTKLDSQSSAYGYQQSYYYYSDASATNKHLARSG